MSKLKVNYGIITFISVLTVAAVIVFQWHNSCVAAIASFGKTIIVDAGHGGFDGGAVADDNTLEKDLNLEIANLLKKYLISSGYRVIMTREDNSALSEHKLDDMRKRLQVMQENRDALFVSIHCNKFPVSSARGLQVFYSQNTESSKELADLIQKQYNTYLNKSCKRVSKPSSNSIYLLDKAPCDAVLIECGFLSNRAELELLKDDTYRNELAKTITNAINRFYEAGL